MASQEDLKAAIASVIGLLFIHHSKQFCRNIRVPGPRSGVDLNAQSFSSRSRIFSLGCHFSTKQTLKKDFTGTCTLQKKAKISDLILNGATMTWI